LAQKLSKVLSSLKLYAPKIYLKTFVKSSGIVMRIDQKTLENIFLSRATALIFACSGLILASVAYFQFKNPPPSSLVASTVEPPRKAKDPQEVERQKKLADVVSLISKDEHYAALEILRALASEVDDNSQIYSNMALAQKKIGLFENAKVSLNRALEIDGGQWILHHNLGVLLFEMGEMDEAIKRFDKALELKPKNAKVLLSKARSLELTGQFFEARVSYGMALEDSSLDGPTKTIVLNRLKKLLVLAYIEREEK
jgi:tetratricopeptide (TPR) repeat protein